VLAALGVRIGDVLPLTMSQNGLGLNNVLYMAVLLAGLTYEPESELHLLLVEEPEAHLHPQMQDLLMRFLQAEVDERDDVQVVVTTHSPNFASAARVERITSMSRRLVEAALSGIEWSTLFFFIACS
jgi:putative ATP-dependent endonuclease of OLD family